MDISFIRDFLHSPRLYVTVVGIVQSLSRVQLFVTLWTVAHQAPLSMGFSRQEYWRRLSCPPPGVFSTQGLDLCLFCLLPWEMGSLSPAPTGKSRNQANVAKCKQFVKMGKGNMDIHCDIISVFQ